MSLKVTKCTATQVEEDLSLCFSFEYLGILSLIPCGHQHVDLVCLMPKKEEKKLKFLLLFDFFREFSFQEHHFGSPGIFL